MDLDFDLDTLDLKASQLGPDVSKGPKKRNSDQRVVSFQRREFAHHVHSG